MRNIKIFANAAFFSAIVLCFVGCEGGDTAYYGPGPSSMKSKKVSEDTSLSQAEEVLQRVQKRRDALQRQAKADNLDLTDVYEGIEEILREECNFVVPNFLSDSLFDRYVANTPQQDPVKQGKLKSFVGNSPEKIGQDPIDFYFDYVSRLDPLVLEYMKISFQNPDVTDAQILEMYEDSVRDGDVNIIFD